MSRPDRRPGEAIPRGVPHAPGAPGATGARAAA